MKTLRLIAVGVVLLLSCSMSAQVIVKVGSPPPWAPAGYSGVRYYYLPDVETYYDVQNSRFIYYRNGVWIHRTGLPAQYRAYDLYDGYKVVMIDYHGDAPYADFKTYKVKYPKGYRGTAQKTIGQKPGRGNSGVKATPNDRSNRNGRSHGYKSGNGKKK